MGLWNKLMNAEYGFKVKKFIKTSAIILMLLGVLGILITIILLFPGISYYNSQWGNRIGLIPFLTALSISVSCFFGGGALFMACCSWENLAHLRKKTEDEQVSDDMPDLEDTGFH